MYLLWEQQQYWFNRIVHNNEQTAKKRNQILMAVLMKLLTAELFEHFPWKYVETTVADLESFLGIGRGVQQLKTDFRVDLL